MNFESPGWFAVLLSWSVAMAATPAVRAAAVRLGFVARPKADRWHQRPTAMLGGVAIFAAVVAAALALVPGTPQSRTVLAASAFLFAVGLLDDVRPLKPYQKLIGQVMAAAAVAAQGLVLPWTGSDQVNVALTLFWLVGVTNAVNLLDNMDGLAAGVAAIAAAFLGYNFAASGQPADALLMAVLAAALVAFLAYNANPASIFMGDCGSLFVGFLLAAAALMHPSGGRSRSFLPVLAVPVLILFIPIFDTTLVMVARKLAGRAASQGGRDHASHRLVALGLSERRAVWMLYAFAVASGLLALLVRDQGVDVGVAAVGLFTLVLTLLGVHLGGVQVYDAAAADRRRPAPLVTFLVDLSYKRRVFEVLLDAVLIILSYHLACAFLYGPADGDGVRRQFLRAAPVLVVVKMAAFLASGVYRGLWRYMSVGNVIVFAKAAVAGSACGAAVLALGLGPGGPPRSVLVLDGLILFTLLTGTRMAFRVLREVLRSSGPGGGRRVLIYGAGDAGELLVRELQNNRGLNYTPVGFVDDDPLKKGKVIHGLRVLGGNGSFLTICRDHAVEEVLLASTRFSPERVGEIVRDCQSASVRVKRMRIQIEQLEEEGVLGLR